MTQTQRDRGFDLIWDWFPHWQNRHSSVWWFFLLTPKQPEGFGPKQMMFAAIARAGEQVGINHTWHHGLDLTQVSGGAEERFNTIVVGWINDGQQLHEDIVHHSCPATLSKSGSLTAWSPQPDGRYFGSELRVTGEKPYGLEARFVGARGCAHFEVWGDPASEVTKPFDALNLNTPLGGSQVIAWRHLRFAGEFVSPAGTEQLEGIGYFQRVCLNFPAFPWKWIWAVFEDESVFSCFVPYVGLHLWRRGDRFMPNFLEQAAVPIRPTGYFSPAEPRSLIRFEKVRVTPVQNGGRYPNFVVECASANGDFLRYTAVPYAHTQFLMDRPVLRRLWQTRFNYNEYLFRIHDLDGRVSGKPLNQRNLGNGFGNCEYTWGLGL